MGAIRRPSGVSSASRPLPVDGAELQERLVTVLDVLRVGPVDEGEDVRVAETEVDHAEDDLGQVGAQDLGRREPGPGFVILLGVEPDADARLDAAAAALALVGAAPGRSG